MEKILKGGFFITLIVFCSSIALYLAIRPEESLADKWARQSSSLQQIGIVLLHYLEENENKMPNSIQVLKSWALKQEKFSSIKSSSIWQFRNPSTNQLQDWQFGSEQKQFIIAPSIREIVVAGKPQYFRLALTRCERGRVSCEYVLEAVYPSIRVP